MATRGIKNPILNSPYEEPCRHLKFDKEGITNEVLEVHRTGWLIMSTIGSSWSSKLTKSGSDLQHLATNDQSTNDATNSENLEQMPTESFESMHKVIRDAKPQKNIIPIPSSIDGQQGNYLPNVIVALRDGEDTENLPHLIIKVTGKKKRDKESNVQTAQSLWVPAVNNQSGLGRWDFLEVNDPWNVGNELNRLVTAALNRN